jgi:hypothetical protein
MSFTLVSVLKKLVKKLLGPQNARRISYIHDDLIRFKNRGFRGCKAFIQTQKPILRRLVRFSVPERQTFFGYYDITPFSEDNKLILATVAPRKNTPPTGIEELIIGYFRRNAPNTFYAVDKTFTWCWQQGCRLQWFPGGHNDLIIYNTMVDGSYGAVVQSVKTNKIVRQYQRPVYQIERTGVYALSLNFSRLHRLRPGYGYGSLTDNTIEQYRPDGDGVWLLNLVTGEVELLIDLNQLAQIQPSASMDDAEHYVNHLTFNPSGKRFLFFHLWVKNKRQHGRLFTCDANGQSLFLVTRETPSHYSWKSETEILATLQDDHRHTKYYLFVDQTTRRVAFGDGVLNEDGHPTYIRQGTTIITDTYPNHYGEQRLLLYSDTGCLTELAHLRTPARFAGEVRCDLHPRPDREGKYVCFDSAHEGTRALYVLDMREA